MTHSKDSGLFIALMGKDPNLPEVPHGEVTGKDSELRSPLHSGAAMALSLALPPSSVQHGRCAHMQCCHLEQEKGTADGNRPAASERTSPARGAFEVCSAHTAHVA